MRRGGVWRFWSVALAVPGMLLPLALAGEAPGRQQEEYVGSDLCRDCHTDAWDSYAGSFHSILELSGDDLQATAGCESCHGPGLTHAEMAGAEEPGFEESIIGFIREPAPLRAEQCLACHTGQDGPAHFRTSRHLRAGVACNDCHTGHLPVSVHAALKEPEPELCYACHGDQRARFSLTERHPVNEGFMTCSDCHDPHGSPNPFQLARVENASCTSCHLDKAGPWVFPHASVEAETCTVCHQPHGSVNPHMLTHREIRFTCLQCHPSQPPFHVQPGFSECNACHTQIHGSNLDPFFLK